MAVREILFFLETCLNFPGIDRAGTTMKPRHAAVLLITSLYEGAGLTRPPPPRPGRCSEPLNEAAFPFCLPHEPPAGPQSAGRQLCTPRKTDFWHRGLSAQRPSSRVGLGHGNHGTASRTAATFPCCVQHPSRGAPDYELGKEWGGGNGTGNKSRQPGKAAGRRQECRRKPV